jgi:hypothetical protein
MDLSFWTQLNPKIVYDPTRKQYYNRFCYKLVVEAYGGRIVNDTPVESVELAVMRRKQLNAHRYNYGGSWYRREQEDLNKINPALIEELRSIKNGYNTIKMRVEEPWVQIYTEDFDTLKSIGWRLKAFDNNLLSVSFPETPAQQSLLEDGNILIKESSKIDFSHKVMFRDGIYEQETKLRILDYLDSLGPDVRVTKANRNMLSGPLTYIWGCFIYTNDPSVTTMLTLLAPGIVRKIHEIVRT